MNTEIAKCALYEYYGCISLVYYFIIFFKILMDFYHNNGHTLLFSLSAG